jgi:Rps23 Pro-64 3,4-dihydroxylase Tpa1-like proline 4-hydroxylase
MKIEVLRDPFCIIIKECFGDKSILFMREIIKNQKRFEDARVGAHGKGVVNKAIRSNITAYYDDLYKDKRNMSPLLTHTGLFFQSQFMHELMNSAPFPLNIFGKTNYHETQVSRYGDSQQKYDWHIDRLTDDSRLVTFSYYLCKFPKKFTGGEIVLSNGLLAENKIHGETNRHKLSVENDMLVIFDSRTPHCVMPTKSPKKFEDGRFSVQMWLGIK